MKILEFYWAYITLHILIRLSIFARRRRKFLGFTMFYADFPLNFQKYWVYITLSIYNVFQNFWKCWTYNMKILIIKPASETIFYILLTFLGFSKCCNFFVFKYFFDWKKVLKSWEANSFIYPENVTCPYGYHNKNYMHSDWNLEIQKYVIFHIFFNFQISNLEFMNLKKI